MEQYRGSAAIHILVSLTGAAAVAIMFWALLSGVGWRWDLW